MRKKINIHYFAHRPGNIYGSSFHMIKIAEESVDMGYDVFMSNFERSLGDLQGVINFREGCTNTINVIYNKREWVNALQEIIHNICIDETREERKILLLLSSNMIDLISIIEKNLEFYLDDDIESNITPVDSIDIVIPIQIKRNLNGQVQISRDVIAKSPSINCPNVNHFIYIDYTEFPRNIRGESVRFKEDEIGAIINSTVIPEERYRGCGNKISCIFYDEDIFRNHGTN